MATSKLLSPQDLKKITDEAENALIKEHEQRKQKQEGEEKELRDSFMSRDVHPEVMDRINNAVRGAAQRGTHEIQVLTFPANYCNDSGRRINNNEADWPESLEGFAKLAYEFHVKELQPLGFKIRVQVLDYPGGMPGNIGMYLSW
jgi:hypothetical protein